MAILSPLDPLIAAINTEFAVSAIEKHRVRAVKPGNLHFYVAKYCGNLASRPQAVREEILEPSSTL
jgi:hypothetical protein